MEKSNIERDSLRKLKEKRLYRAFRILEKEWPCTKWSTICEVLEKAGCIPYDVQWKNYTC